MRIHKLLAQQGFGSLRSIEKAISAREIKVNNKLAEIGQEIKLGDTINWQNKNIKLIINNNILNFKNTLNSVTRVLLYNKPEGEICSHSNKNRDDFRSEYKQYKTIYEDLPKLNSGKWLSIGRLDLNTSGLILITNNGQLVQKLSHPKYNHTREYLVRVFGLVTDKTLTKLKQGVKLEDGMAKFNKIVPVKKSSNNNALNNNQASNYWFKVSLTSGKNRIVRRLWNAVNCEVSRLMRTKFAEFSLPKDLLTGQYRELEQTEVHKLLN